MAKGSDFYSNVTGISVSGTAADDTISIYGNHSTLTAGDGNDVILLHGGRNAPRYTEGDVEEDVILGEGGDDSVKVESRGATVYGGTGKDTIRYDGLGGKYADANFYADGGADNDLLVVSTYANSSGYDGKKNITLQSGSGEDTVNVEVNSGYNDFSKKASFVVTDFSGDDTFKVTAGSNDSSKLGTVTATESGDDVILTDGTNFTATLLGVGGLANISDADIDVGGTKKSFEDYFNIPDSGDSDSDVTLPAGITIKDGVLTVSKAYAGSSVDVADYDDYDSEGDEEDIKVVDATAVTKKFAIVGNDEDNSIAGGTNADTISGGVGNDTLTGGAGKDIFVHTEGDDVITDYKVGTDKIKLDTDVEITGGDVDSSDVILYTTNGSIKVVGMADKKITVIDSEGGSSKVTYSDKETTPTAPSGTSYSKNKTVLTVSDSFTGNEINLADYSTVVTVNAKNVKGTNLEITGNENNNSIRGGSGSDVLYGASGDDTLYGGAGRDTFVHYEGNDVIADYVVGKDKIQLQNTEIVGTSLKGSDVVFTTDNGTLTVKNAKNKKLTIVDADGIESEKVYNGLANGVKYTNSNKGLRITKDFNDTDVDLSDYVDTVVTVDASAASQPVNVIGNRLNNRIIGSKNGDTLVGGEGDDYIKDVKGGEDTFVYVGGNDTIEGYTPNSDVIYLGDAIIEDAEYKVNDVILKIEGGGSIRVKGAKNKYITTVDSEGEEKKRKYPLGKADVSLNYSKGLITIGKDYEEETFELSNYDSKYTKVVVNSKYDGDGIDIIGTDKNNSLVGGKGDDTLEAGEGKNTLTGGSGDDVFVHMGGKDLITDYKSGDKIQFTEDNDVEDYKVKGSNVIFTTENGSVTVKGGKGKSITLVDADGEEKVVKYKSGSGEVSSNVPELWFDPAGEVAVAEPSISQLVADKDYSVAEVESSNVTALTKDSVVVYAAK